MSAIAGPSSAPFRRAFATTSARLVSAPKATPPPHSNDGSVRPETAQALEKSYIVISGVPRTYTSEDVHLKLRHVGALRFGDIALTSIVGRPKPVAPPISTMPRPSTTSFHLTFPNEAAAAHAEKTLRATNARCQFLSIKKAEGSTRRSMDRVLEGQAVNAVEVTAVQFDAKAFWSDAVRVHVGNNHWFQSALPGDRSKKARNGGEQEREASEPKEENVDSKKEMVNRKKGRSRDPMTAGRREEANKVVNAFQQARIGPFGADDKMIKRGELPRSGRQVALYGLPGATRADSLTPILEGFSLDESDPLFWVPIQPRTNMKTFIVTLADVAEAHRFVRKINMQDVTGGDGYSNVIRADIMW